MIALRYLVALGLVALSSGRVAKPIRAEMNDDDTVYTFPRPAATHMKGALGTMMHMAYNNTIPISALRKCDVNDEAVCPTPDGSGEYQCVALGDICDGRPQCPGMEDETPVICFFYQVHADEMERLRSHAIELYREMSAHAPRKHANYNNGN